MPDPMSWSNALPLIIAALICGYALGSIPFGVILTKAFGAGDLSKIGSGNIGATNVLRTGKKSLAAATLLGDLLKGTVAVLLANYLFDVAGQTTMAIIAGFGAFIGHLYPLWLKFKGGKGVATYIGILLGLVWQCALIFCAIWLIIAFLFRISSLAALVASLIAPIILWWLGYIQEAQLFIILSVLIWFKHRENIKRILSGTESRIGDKG